MTELRLLGPVELSLEARTAEVGPPQRRTVLADCAGCANRPRSWGRRGYGCCGAPEGYLLEARPDQVDIHRFRQLTGRARERGRRTRAPGRGPAARRSPRTARSPRCRVLGPKSTSSSLSPCRITRSGRGCPPAPGRLPVRVVGLRSSVLTVIVLGQVEGTDLTPVAVHDVLGLLRRPLSARRLRRQALSGSTGGGAHVPGSLQRRPTRCTAVRGGRAWAAVSARKAPSREQHRCRRGQRADGVHRMTGHRFLLPNAWTVPGSSAPVSHSQRHRWDTKTSQPSPGRASTPGGQGRLHVRPRGPTSNAVSFSGTGPQTRNSWTVRMGTRRASSTTVCRGTRPAT